MLCCGLTWQATEHHTTAHLHPPPAIHSGAGEEERKSKSKIKNCLISKGEVEEERKETNWTKPNQSLTTMSGMMPAMSKKKGWLISLNILLSILLLMTIYVLEYPFA